MIFLLLSSQSNSNLLLLFKILDISFRIFGFPNKGNTITVFQFLNNKALLFLGILQSQSIILNYFDYHICTMEIK